MKPFVEIHPDHVHIEKHTVFRPTTTSPSEWLEFWAKLDQRDENEIYNEGFEAGQLEPLD